MAVRSERGFMEEFHAFHQIANKGDFESPVHLVFGIREEGLQAPGKQASSVPVNSVRLSPSA